MSSESDGSIGEAEATLVLASENILAHDNIPDANQQVDCFSCGEIMTGLFCHACGQKNDDYRRSAFALLTEAFTSVFSLENRMWRTWMSLIFKPGKVAREYSDGKRTNWTSPVRMYLALSIILFGYMSLTETRIFSIRTDIVPKAGFEGPVETLSDASVQLKPDVGFFRRQAEIDRLSADTDFKRISELMTGAPRQVFVFDGNLETLGLTPSNEHLVSSGSWPSADDVESDPESLRELALETYAEDLENVIESYNELLSATKSPNTIIDRILQAEEADEALNLAVELSLTENKKLQQTADKSVASIETALELFGLTRADIHKLPVETRTGIDLGIGHGSVSGIELSQTDIQKLGEQILRNPAILNDGISKYLPRIMFLMMPFAAVIGLIFIRDKKRALFYDHLVHATYIHAVTFAFLFILILVAQWTPLGGSGRIFILGMLIYLPFSAKTMFRRGWFKTILSSYMIAALYGFVMMIVIIFLTAGSIVETVEAGKLLT